MAAMPSAIRKLARKSSGVDSASISDSLNAPPKKMAKTTHKIAPNAIVIK